MNEIHHIHLGRQAYTVSADAYKLLHDYLEAIKHKAGKEVAEEVELRMAELLTERGVSGEKVVLRQDVDYLKAQLGKPGDFSDEEATDDNTDDDVEVSGASKRLFRDPDNAMVAGVAAGLAKYLDIDTVIVRIIFIALVFFGGSGILLYLILWLLVPEAKTSSDKLQMRGLAVNVENIKQAIEKADVPGATRRVGRGVGKVLSVLVRIVLTIVGIGFVIAGIGMLIGSGVAAIYGLTGGVHIGKVTLFPVGGKEVAVLVCGFVILALIAGLLTAVGLTLGRRNWPVPGWALAAIIGVFVVAASVGTALGFDVAPGLEHRYQGLQSTRTYTVAPITKLHILGTNAFYSVVQEDQPTVEVHTYNGVKDINSIVVKSDPSGELTVDTRAFHGDVDCTLVCPFGARQATIIVGVPDIATVPVDAPSGASVALKNDTVEYDTTETDNGATMLSVPHPVPVPQIPATDPTGN